MLTKSQAKVFFLGGTAICTLTFLVLTVDTLAKMPERSNQANMSESVVRGHHIWNRNNCMGCHSLMGEGAYYAPELTKIVQQKGKTFLAEFLEDPEFFYPGRRKMVKYDMFDPDIVGEEEASKNKQDILAFLEWVGEIDLNGFPPDPDLKEANTASAEDLGVLKDAPEYFTSYCMACHAVAGKGNKIAPALDGISERYDEEYLRKWIADPQKVKPGTTMPKLDLDQETLDEIVTFLKTL